MTARRKKGTGTFIVMIGWSWLLPGVGDCVECKCRRSAILEKSQKAGLLPKHRAPSATLLITW
jgi:hypothetical protein